MADINTYFPYIYGAFAAINTYHFLKKGQKDMKNPDNKVLFYGSLAASIDLLPVMWGDNETLSQKAGLEFKSVGAENFCKGAEIAGSFLGQIMGLYHNLGMNRDFKQYDKIKLETKKVKKYHR